MSRLTELSRLGPFLWPATVVASLWALALARRSLGIGFRLKRSSRSLPISVVSPVYAEQPELFREALRSWLANDVHEVICVIDITDADSLAVAGEFPVTVVTTSVVGKRAALRRGWERATTPLVALVDSDTIWATDTADRLRHGFADPRAGAVAAAESVHQPDSLARRLHDLRLDSLDLPDRRAQSRMGARLMSMSASTTAYVRELLIAIGDEFVDERFRGEARLGDEHLWLAQLIRRRGFRTVVQPAARVWTAAPADMGTAARRWVRQMRNTWVARFRVLSGEKRRIFLTWSVLEGSLTPFARLTNTFFLVTAVVRGDLPVAGLFVAWWAVATLLRMSGHIRRHPGALAMLPVAMVSNLPLAVLEVYGLFTMRRRRFYTRPVEIDPDGNLVRTGVSRLVPAPAVTPLEPFVGDPVVIEGLVREGVRWGTDDLRRFAARISDTDTVRIAAEVAALQGRSTARGRIELGGDLTHSLSWHQMVGLSVAEGLRTATSEDRPGEGAIRDARMFLMSQLEPSHLTPISTTAAATLGLADDTVGLWSRLATTRSYDPRPIGAPDKTGVMIGLGFTAGSREGVRVTRAGQSYVHTVTGSAMLTNAGPYDGILVPVNTPDGRRTTFLVPMRDERGGANGVRVTRVFGRAGSSPTAFAEVTFEDSTAWRVGEFGGASEVMTAPIDRLRLDSVLAGAGRMRKAVSWAAYHASEEGLLDDPVATRLIASAEIQTEVAVLMMARMSALFDRADRLDRRYERLLLTLTQHWVSTRSERVLSTARQVSSEAGFPLPSDMNWDPPLVAMWAKAETALSGDIADLVTNHRDVLEPFEAEVEVLRREGGRFADVHAWLLTTLRNGPAGRLPWPGVLEAGALVWGAALLLRNGRRDVATAMLRMHLGGLSDLLFGSRSLAPAVRSVADKAVPEGKLVWFGEGDDALEVVVDLREVEPAARPDARR